MKFNHRFFHKTTATPPASTHDPETIGETLDDRLAILTQSSASPRTARRPGDRRIRRWAMPVASVIVLLLGIGLLTAAWRGWLTASPDLAEGLNYVGEGDNVRAIHFFSRMLRDRETDLAARYYLGAAYHNYGWHDEALEQYDKTLRLSLDYSARAAHSAARIHATRGEYNQSLALFNLALQFAPGSAEIRKERDALTEALQAAVSQGGSTPQPLNDIPTPDTTPQP